MAAVRGKIGLLLINLGTPSAPDYWPIRRYLAEFLADRRVIEAPRLKWWLIRQLFVLPFRPARLARKYRPIWNRARNESPLMSTSRAQAEKLADRLARGGDDDLAVDFAMRYGAPSIASGLERMVARGCDRVLCVPLYPQYSATTTATANDAAFRALMGMRVQPALRTMPPWFDEPLYIDALASSILRAPVCQNGKPEKLVLSFHGIPVAYARKGDPYETQCRETTRLLAARLGWEDGRVECAFQSRFGKDEWLQPYTAERVVALARAGVRDLAIMAPGFTADCLETCEEIEEEIYDLFKGAGGRRFHYIPCLNDSDDHIALLAALVQRECGGWLSAPAGEPALRGARLLA